MNKSPKIYLICDDPKIVDYFSLVIFSDFQLSLEVFEDVGKLLCFLQKEDYPDLLIFTVPNDEIQLYFDSFSEGKTIPVLFAADDNNIHLTNKYIPYHPLCAKVSYNINSHFFCKAISRLLRIKSRTSPEEKFNNIARPAIEKKYLELPVSLFLRNKINEYDLYLKISDQKYLKVFNKGELLNIEDFTKYKDRGVKTVYLISNDYIKVSTDFSKKLSAFLKVKNLRFNQYITASIFIHDKVKTIVNRIGLREEVLVLANQALEMNWNLIKKRSSLKELLDNTMKKDSFVSEHSLMMTFVTTSIAKYLKWPSSVTAEKLSMACFFHDIAILDDELAIIDNLENCDLDDKKMNIVKRHMQMAAELLEEVEGMPKDVDKIIMQHHERADGSGFPRGLDWKNIFPLAAVFIVAEDFTTAVFEMGLDGLEVKCILENLKKKYKAQGLFSQAVEALDIAMGYQEPRVLGED